MKHLLEFVKGRKISSTDDSHDFIRDINNMSREDLKDNLGKVYPNVAGKIVLPPDNGTVVHDGSVLIAFIDTDDKDHIYNNTAYIYTIKNMDDRYAVWVYRVKYHGSKPVNFDTRITPSSLSSFAGAWANPNRAKGKYLYLLSDEDGDMVTEIV